MGLIKKMLKITAGTGIIIAGLPLGAGGLGASVPIYKKMMRL